MTQTSPPHGLILVYTGPGKGKTTAALGLVMRACGKGLRVAVIQFIKSGRECGEHVAARSLGIPVHVCGDGFTWASKDIQETIRHARQGWEKACELILRGDLDVLVLDEFTYPLHYAWLETRAVLDWLEEHRPPGMHIVITGRNAPPLLLERADLVTEMQDVKHPLRDQGIPAQSGIDF